MQSTKLWVTALTILFVAGCGAPKPEEVSDDQMNHFAGIDEHDHPLSAGANEQANSASEKSQIKGEEHPASTR